jgi:hypothetical protein
LADARPRYRRWGRECQPIGQVTFRRRAAGVACRSVAPAARSAPKRSSPSTSAAKARSVEMTRRRPFAPMVWGAKRAEKRATNGDPGRAGSGLDTGHPARARSRRRATRVACSGSEAALCGKRRARGGRGRTLDRLRVCRRSAVRVATRTPANHNLFLSGARLGRARVSEECPTTQRHLSTGQTKKACKYRPF